MTQTAEIISVQKTIRSYLVTFGFVAFRLIDEMNIFATLGTERFATTAWLCWTIPLLLAEVAL